MPAKPAAPSRQESVAQAPRRKRSYNETRELEALPARIEALEGRLAELASQLNEPAFYQADSDAITAHHAAMAQAQAELDAAYARWEALESD